MGLYVVDVMAVDNNADVDADAENAHQLADDEAREQTREHILGLDDAISAVYGPDDANTYTVVVDVDSAFSPTVDRVGHELVDDGFYHLNTRPFEEEGAVDITVEDVPEDASGGDEFPDDAVAATARGCDVTTRDDVEQADDDTDDEWEEWDWNTNSPSVGDLVELERTHGENREVAVTRIEDFDDDLAPDIPFDHFGYVPTGTAMPPQEDHVAGVSAVRNIARIKRDDLQAARSER